MLAAITSFEQPQAPTEKKPRRRLRLIVEIVGSLLVALFTAYFLLFTNPGQRIRELVGLYKTTVLLPISSEPAGAIVYLIVTRLV
jgi:hypothetical protein